MIDRRAILVGMLATCGSGAWGTPADPVAAALDEAAKLPPAAAIDRLAGIDVTRLSRARRLDVTAARAGLAVDAALLTAPGDIALGMQRTLGGVAIEKAEVRLTRELAVLHRRAEREFDGIGEGRGTIGERYRALFADPRFHYPDSDVGRAAAVADMNVTLAELRDRTRRHIAPPAFTLDAVARPLSQAEIAAGKGGYREVPVPERAGAYIVDLKDIARRPRWSLPSVVAHELLPGHMIQLGIEGIDPPHPLRLTYAAAFVEGWATYAETLAADWGVFRTPRDRLGHLHWLIFRVARGLVDINIHRHGWSTDRARAALLAWQGEPAYFAPFDTDLARIARDPGVRAAEAMAWLSIADRAARHVPSSSRFIGALLADGRKRSEQLP